MRAIMQQPKKQQIEGIYSFRFNHKVYEARVQAQGNALGYMITARPANAEWVYIATVPAFEIVPEQFSAWRARLRLLVAKAYRLQ
jgi:hypothetical protein